MITLNNGRIVADRPMDNGAKKAFMLDGGCMSSDEWEEYCAKLNRKMKDKGFKRVTSGK